MKIILQPGDDFDHALELATAGDEVVLEPGIYETRGPWASRRGNLNVADGVTIQAGTATIRLISPIGIIRPDRDLPILRCGVGVTIEGGTWDANHAGNPGWFCQGIRFHGQFRVAGAKIIGMSGSRNSGTPTGAVESFAISSQGPTGGSMVEDVIVQDCKSSNPDDYVSGIYIGTTGDVASAAESIVRNCVVRLAPYGQFAFASNGATLFERCEGRALRFWYNDTGDTYSARLVACSGEGNYAAVSCVGTPTGTVRQVRIEGGKFRFPRGVEWWDKTENHAMTGEVLAIGADFVCLHPASTMARGGIVRFVQCLFPFGVSNVIGSGSIVPEFDPPAAPGPPRPQASA